MLELLVASSVSSIIIVAMVNLFVWSEKNILQQQALLIAINKIKFINYYLNQASHQGKIVSYTPHNFKIQTKSGSVITFYLAKVEKTQYSTSALFEKTQEQHYVKRRLELVRPVVNMNVVTKQNHIEVVFVLRSETKIAISKSLKPDFKYYTWKLILPRVCYASC